MNATLIKVMRDKKSKCGDGPGIELLYSPSVIFL